MTDDPVAAARRPDWFAPFAWVLAAPLFVVPVTTLLILVAEGSIVHENLDGREPLNPEGNKDFNPYAGAFGSWFEPEYDYVERWPLLLIYMIPALYYMWALHWISIGPARVRVAGAIAGLLGLALLLIPVLVWESERAYSSAGTDYYAFDSEGFFGGFWWLVAAIWIMVALVLLACTIAVGVFGCGLWVIRRIRGSRRLPTTG